MKKYIVIRKTNEINDWILIEKFDTEEEAKKPVKHWGKSEIYEIKRKVK